MIIFLILGAALGIVSMVFFFQNVTPVTVTFFSMQMGGSLAVMLFLAMLSGVIVTLLLLLPRFVRDEFRIGRAKKREKALEDEIAQLKAATVPPPPPPQESFIEPAQL